MLLQAPSEPSEGLQEALAEVEHHEDTYGHAQYLANEVIRTALRWCLGSRPMLCKASEPMGADTAAIHRGSQSRHSSVAQP